MTLGELLPDTPGDVLVTLDLDNLDAVTAFADAVDTFHLTNMFDSCCDHDVATA